MVGSFSLMFEFLVNRAIRAFGAGFAENVVLLGCEQFFPLGVGLLNLARGIGGDF